MKTAQNERKRELHETKKRFYYYNLIDSVSIKHRISTKNVCKYYSIILQESDGAFVPQQAKSFLKQTVKTAPNEQKNDFHST